MTRNLVIVTGAASGIGLATVERFLAEGWPVTALDRDAAGLDTLAERLGDEALSVHPIDLTDEAAIAAFVAGLGGRPVAGLVNSAGVGFNTSFRDTTPDMFRRIYEINVIAAFALAKALLPALEAGEGSVVNVASVSGMVGNAGRSAYGASKGALITLTKIMAVELAPAGVRVNAVSPGPIETAMVREFHDAGTRERWLNRVAMRRYGQPEEIAGTIGFLVDPRASSYVTGQILAVDGGFATAGLLP
ncbi:SDR family NAD(P)-dependent oxidoreductase [Aureimonas sp. SK2]|uniref:SDR family NAD(P)-dependent oxidoreductase n=1 Tax=Aureimonas sp. SK2 TaxID=3015992 RepID=UPI00244502A9|nr:SDR family NAD(P)-dependent oxidoreductase [Aureimonas sp. SK2]